MLQLIKDAKIPFTKIRYWGYAFSIATLLMTAVLLIINKGPLYGIDFTGGTRVGLEFSKEISTAEIRSALTSLGENDVKIFRIQSPGSKKIGYDVQIPPRTTTVKSGELTFSQKLVNKLNEVHPDTKITVTGQESVSAGFGKELQTRAIIAILVGILLTLIYLGIRINFRFSSAIAISVFHDVFFTLGIITLAGIKMEVTVVAAFLTLVGYSVNDSIVVSKRIQELIKLRRGATLEENINEGINNTLSRTIITSLTVFMVTLALVIFASKTAVFSFALTMCIGVIVGTYSSIFVVSPLVLEWEKLFPSRKRRR